MDEEEVVLDQAGMLSLEEGMSSNSMLVQVPLGDEYNPENDTFEESSQENGVISQDFQYWVHHDDEVCCGNDKEQCGAVFVSCILLGLLSYGIVNL